MKFGCEGIAQEKFVLFVHRPVRRSCSAIANQQRDEPVTVRWTGYLGIVTSMHCRSRFELLETQVLALVAAVALLLFLLNVNWGDEDAYSLWSLNFSCLDNPSGCS